MFKFGCNLNFDVPPFDEIMPKFELGWINFVFENLARAHGKGSCWFVCT